MINKETNMGDTIIVGNPEDIMSLQKMKVTNVYEVAEEEFYLEGILTKII